MPQVTTTRRPWETIALSLVALLRPLPRTRGKPAPETTAGAEAAAVRRGEAELLSLALAVCAALFVIKGFIAYRDLDNPAVPPLVYDWGCNFFRVAMLLPWTTRRAPGATAAAWRERRGTVIAIAVMSPLAYILVLTAMVFTPVSLIAPAREVSILFAALMGAHLLREGDITRRVVAAVGMALGVAGLALG